LPGVELKGYIQRSSVGDGNDALMTSAHASAAIIAEAMVDEMRRT
jgi:hypothetical protein